MATSSSEEGVLFDGPQLLGEQTEEIILIVNFAHINILNNFICKMDKALSSPRHQTLKKNLFVDHEEFELEGEYYNKLKQQRMKIEQLQSQFEEVSSKAAQLEIEVENRDKIIEQLKEKNKETVKLKEVLFDLEMVKNEHEKTIKDRNELSKKLEGMTTENQKSLRELKDYFTNEYHRFEEEILQLRENNQQLEIRLTKAEKKEADTKKQYLLVKQKHDKLQKQVKGVQERYRTQFINFEKVLDQRDDQVAKYKQRIQTLEKKTMQQSYYIQEEKQRSQQIEQEFISVITQLKQQNKQLQRDAFILKQSKQDNSEEQKRTLAKFKEYESKIIGLEEELKQLKIQNQQIINKSTFIVREQKRKLASEREVLEKEYQSLKRDHYVLNMRYNKLTERLSKKEIKDKVRKDLLESEHLEIDRLTQLLKM